MIRIELHEIGTTTILDLTPYLDAKNRTVLTDERERSAFERVVGDVHITISNLRGAVLPIFEPTDPTTRWEIEVKLDGVTKWLGEIDNESIEVDYRDKWVTFDVFAKTKMFWDRVKTIDMKYLKGDYWGPLMKALWISLGDFLALMEANKDISDSVTIFRGFDLGDFAGKLLRGGLSAAAPIGNEGMVIYLDPTHTVDEILKGILLHYNAQIYIDPVTRKLTMRKREHTPATFLNIDQLMSQRHDIKVKWLDSERYDYVKTYRQIKFPAPIVYRLTPMKLRLPTGEPLNAGQILPGTYTWRAVGYTWDSQAIMVSEDVTYTLPGPTNDVSGWQVTFWLTHKIPSVVTQIKFFRKDNVSGKFLFVCDVGPVGSDVTFTDIKGDWNLYAQGDAGVMPYVSSAFEVYESYTEEDGWDEPLVDYGTLKIEGKVFDARPTFRWWTGTAYEFQEDVYQTFSFFGRDLDSVRFRESYKDMLLIKRGAAFTLKGPMAVAVGDGVESLILPNDLTPERHYIVKKISSDLTSERTTTVEAFSI